MLILILLHFFYIIIINFIMIFSEKLNFLFIITDKFSQQVALIAEKLIYFANQ